MLGLPEKVFYTPEDLQGLWDFSESDIKHYLLQGALVAHVWLPMLSIYEIMVEEEGNRIICTKELKHWEGYTPLYAHQCRALYQSGEVYFRDFMCQEENKGLFLPEMASGVFVRIADIVILNEERKRFEEDHLYSRRSVSARSLKRASYFEQAFRKVHHAGMDFSFGSIQATVLQQLYDAARNGEPWQSGKKLLERAGSISFTMQNVFKSNPHWRKLIESDGRGDYRLDGTFIESLCDP